MTGEDHHGLTVRIPANVDQADKILASLTARQLAILTVTGAATALVHLLCRDRLPLFILAALLLPLGAVGVAIALGRRDGISLDRFLGFALVHLRSRKHRVPAPEGVSAPPAWCRVRGRLPAPLRLPVKAIRTDGVLRCSDGRMAVLVRTSMVSFALRTDAEQVGLVAGFARWLNALDAPVQILVRARPVDLSDMANALIERAPALPNPALERAAHAHAAFVTELAESRDLLARDVLVVITATTPSGHHRPRDAEEAAAALALRRAVEAERALTALGASAEVLDGERACRALGECLDATGPAGALADPDDPITTAEEAKR